MTMHIQTHFQALNFPIPKFPPPLYLDDDENIAGCTGDCEACLATSRCFIFMCDVFRNEILDRIAIRVEMEILRHLNIAISFRHPQIAYMYAGLRCREQNGNSHLSLLLDIVKCHRAEDWLENGLQLQLKSPQFSIANRVSFLSQCYN
jgi:hypothetical protein